MDLKNALLNGDLAKFSTTAEQFGFQFNSHDEAIFVRQSDGGILLLLVYVDNVTITGNDIEEITNPKQYLIGLFEMKDLHFLHYFLGIEVSSS